MKETLLLNIEAQTNSKITPKFLNVNFWIHFVFVQEKMEENGVCALIHPILHTFDTADAEN